MCQGGADDPRAFRTDLHQTLAGFRRSVPAALRSATTLSAVCLFHPSGNHLEKHSRDIRRDEEPERNEDSIASSSSLPHGKISRVQGLIPFRLRLLLRSLGSDALALGLVSGLLRRDERGPQLLLPLVFTLALRVVPLSRYLDKGSLRPVEVVRTRGEPAERHLERRSGKPSAWRRSLPIIVPPQSVYEDAVGLQLVG